MASGLQLTGIVLNADSNEKNAQINPLKSHKTHFNSLWNHCRDSQELKNSSYEQWPMVPHWQH